MAAAAPTTRALEAQIDRVTRHELFRDCDALKRLLIYLGQHAQRHPGEAAKEYTLATAALGRGADFDSRTDSSVRVQVGRLRSRLSQYYDGPGSRDALRLTIPRGSYILQATAATTTIAAAAEPVAAPATIVPRPTYPSAAYILLATACILTGVLLGATLSRFL